MKQPSPFGKYYLLERINVGGMAEVFRAKAYGVEGFERLVAVKRILPNIAEDTEFIKMFIDEAKIAVQLNHANIAQIFDLGMVGADYYIALEHIHGRDLRNIFDRCRNQGAPMPVAQACFVVMKVCEGLDYAHHKRDSSGRELNLVHRDVSPQNVLVSFEGEVKLIDFGIAKAAGKGSKTQAGILKGKFGYMSPEQVRGLPIDCRSDIFACGIVLYELLTGERLFVGESDFSTLEKVRNVEILPPSTYNRKIPDELERIVLKALAKDVEDRYQNAIDLHDELQAFVYTAGEFYSRKDLAGWCKRVFAREIEEETAKLESYRELRPPPEVRGGARGHGMHGPADSAELNGGRRQAKATLAMPAVAPPPIPASASERPGKPPSLPAPRSAKGRHGAPVLNESLAAARSAGGDGLEWDDDELETQIYDDIEPGMAMPVGAASPASAPSVLSGAGGGLAAASHSAEPDLSSLVQRSNTAQGWGTPDPTSPSPSPGTPSNGSQASPTQPPPLNLANGSNTTPSPFSGVSTGGAPGAGEDHGSSSRAIVALTGEAARSFESTEGSADLNSSFAGASVVSPRGVRSRGKSRAGLYVAIGAIALLLIGGGIGLAIALSGGGSDGSGSTVAAENSERAAANSAGASSAAVGAQNAGAGPANAGAAPIDSAVLAQTGFDLYVQPASIKDQVTIKLDGKVYATAPPAKFRKIAPGDHTLVIDGPSGYASANQEITISAGNAGRVNIRLKALSVATTFKSTPPGAEVTIVSNGSARVVGSAPVTEKLDPSQRYEVKFVKRGYVEQTRPVEFSGNAEQVVMAVLSRAHSIARNDGESRRPPRGRDITRTRPSSGSSDDSSSNNAGSSDTTDAKPAKPAKPAKSKATGTGTLMLGAKPPCMIYIDGKNTGKKTPQRSLKLKAGRHKITLVNNTYGIKETFSITIKANVPNKVNKNMMSKVKKP